MSEKVRTEVKHFQYIESGTNTPHPHPIQTVVFPWTVSEQFTRIGTKVENWRQKIANGENASSGMTISDTFVKSIRSVSARADFDGFDGFGKEFFWISLSGNAGNIPPIPPSETIDSSFEAGVSAIALRKFVDKLWMADHQFQGGVFFGEIVPTLRMLASPFSSLRRGVGNYLKRLRILRGREKSPITLKKLLADTWLEFSFGWQPLLSDVKNAIKALERLHDKKYYKFLSAQSRDEGAMLLQNAGDQIYNGSFVFHTEDRKKTVFIKRYYGMLRHSHNEFGELQSDRILKLSGFDLRSWVPTAWELIPYSWLIDYFFNVGQIIATLSADFSNLRWKSSVYRRETVCHRITTFDSQLTNNRIGGPQHPVSSGHGGSGLSKRIFISRDPNASIDYVGQHYSAELGWRQLANISAIVSQGHALQPYYRR